jgi:hypothetical protein
MARAAVPGPATRWRRGPAGHGGGPAALRFRGPRRRPAGFHRAGRCRRLLRRTGPGYPPRSLRRARRGLPPWPTPLAQVIASPAPPSSAASICSLHQAARQVELMTGIKPAPWTRCAPPAMPNRPAAPPSPPPERPPGPPLTAPPPDRPAARKLHRWSIDVAPAASMGHRCCLNLDAGARESMTAGAYVVKVLIGASVTLTGTGAARQGPSGKDLPTKKFFLTK